MLNHPDMPASHVDWRRHADIHLLLVVLRGAALLVTAANGGPGGVEDRRTVAAGEAVLIPSGLWHRLDVNSGGVVAPVGLSVRDFGPREARLVGARFSKSWEPWLLHHFVSDNSRVKSVGETARDLFRNVMCNGGERNAAPNRIDDSSLSSLVRAVILGLLEDPSDGRDARAWAKSNGVSVRTLHRRFQEDTGLSFGAWRRQVRMYAAKDYLRRGYNVTWVADQVGFGNVSAFIRSFSESYGVSPGRWSQRQTGGDVPKNVHIAQKVRVFGSLGESIAGMKAPGIPGSVTKERAHSGHLLLWVYVGTGTVTVVSQGYRRDIDLVRGDAIWIPAGVVIEVRVHPNSVLLPLDFGIGRELNLGASIRVVKIPPAERDWMLWHTIANLTRIRPAKYDRNSALDIVLDSVDSLHSSRMDMPADGPAHIVAAGLLRNLADSRDLITWAEVVGTGPHELDRSFREETGRNFVSWRATLRLRAAHDLMAAGISPSAAARRVGYKYLSGFSRDFSRHYGMTPRMFMGE